MSSDDRKSGDVGNRKKIGCLVIDPAILDHELKGMRIYVHRAILKWILGHIDENIPNEDLKAKFDKVHHHNLDGQLYFIKFYQQRQLGKYFTLYKIKKVLDTIKDQLKYKLVWEKRRKYFLKIDSSFEKRKIRIMNELHTLSLHDSVKVTSLDVNWLYIPKIEVYDFPDCLTDDQINEIDLIFKEMSESQSPLFICEQFEWHKYEMVGRYISVDTLSMDICADEWRRYDLLKEFGIEDILNLDLANKDYRNAYFNKDLHTYLDVLLKKLAPQLSPETDEKLEFYLSRLPEYLYHYFVSRFYNKINSLDSDDLYNLESKHDIPKIYPVEKQIYLRFNKPHLDELLLMDYSNIVYNITNYNYFSGSLFRALLNKPNVKQTYIFRFDKDFHFVYGLNQQMPLHRTNDLFRSFGFKQIVIALVDCIENNAEMLSNYMKLLIDLFRERQKSKVEVTIKFKNCVLHDYSFLENIGNCIGFIKFVEMKFRICQLNYISRALTQQIRIEFEDCEDITDGDVMTVLENIGIDYLCIKGTNSCTDAVYFRLVKHLMNKDGVDTVMANKFYYNMKDCWLGFWDQFNHDLVEFEMGRNYIVIHDFENQRVIRIDDRLEAELLNITKLDKFSCWNQIKPNWMESAVELKDWRIYVHREILEWIVEHIDENMLNNSLRATVEEVYHHNLDGQVYLIKFYKPKNESQEFLQIWKMRKVKDHLKYKQAWKTRPVYFLKIDSHFKRRNIRIMNELQKLILHDSFKPKSFDVNWLYIPKIEIYEFSDCLTADQISEIDLIFKEMSESQSSLFICEQFEWHKDKVAGKFISVDTLCMDICAEEWRRYDLLKDFGVEDILNVDLANRDYRNEYYDEYLDRYLDILLKKLAPQLSPESDEKLEFYLGRVTEYVCHYFVSRFYNKISSLDSNDVYNLQARHDIVKIDPVEKEIYLRFNEPHPDEIVTTKNMHVAYFILNYNYFSDSLFRALLNKPNVKQRYIIRFDKEFYFNYGSNQQLPLHRTNGFVRSFGFRTIVIRLVDCSENNAEHLANFVKYLIDLFKEMLKSEAEIWLVFKNYMLDDYTFFENIGSCFDVIKFEEMKFTSSQLKLLGRLLKQQIRVEFDHCEDITDTNVMTVLENIEFNRLHILGTSACTPAVFFLMAEHLMNKEGGNIKIRINRFNNMSGLFAIFEDMKITTPSLVEFVKVGDQIIIRDIRSKKIKSLYCSTDENSDDESLDSSNNVYNE